MNEYEKEMMDLYKKSLGEKQDFHGIVCPGSQKKPCRLCDLCKEILFDRSIPKEAPLRKRASSLNAKQHYFSNVVFLADPSTVIVFEYGDKIFKQLLAMQMNADQGFKDFWHPIVGRWMIIERIQGATKEQVDYYVKPKDPTKLTDMSILSRMYNLSTITDLTKDGKVKPIYQSKLEKTSIMRILPSWLGPDYGLKFFEKIEYHYNISEEDFRACQAGEINPVRIGGVESVTKTEWKPIGTEPKWEVPPKQEVQPVPVRTVSKEEALWGVSGGEPVAAPITTLGKTEESVPLDDDELPACYGEFDTTDPDCSVQKCAEWSEGCKQYRDEKLAKRRAAKRLSR
uniref:Uncharacterized protein n=1 Tax=viral metagenome TaxID=1070528 RepID=A0A6M3IUY1_9ZZZZ